MPNILVHLDDETLARSMLPAVSALAKAGRAGLLLVTAPDPSAPTRWDAAGCPEPPEWLTSVADRLEKRHLPVTVAVLPSEGLQEFLAAQPEEVALAVIPLDARVEESPVIPGELTRWVTRVIPRSLVVIPVDPCQESTSILLRRVLVALDGTHGAEEALKCGLAWMDPQDTELRLVQVVSDDAPWDLIGTRVARARRYLEGCAAGLREDGWKVAVDVNPAADVATGLSGEAAAKDVDLVIIATRHPGGRSEPDIGATVSDVVRSAGRPVMVVRPCLHPCTAPHRPALAREAGITEGGHRDHPGSGLDSNPGDATTPPSGHVLLGPGSTW